MALMLLVQYDWVVLLFLMLMIYKTVIDVQAHKQAWFPGQSIGFSDWPFHKKAFISFFLDIIITVCVLFAFCWSVSFSNF